MLSAWLELRGFSQPVLARGGVALGQAQPKFSQGLGRGSSAPPCLAGTGSVTESAGVPMTGCCPPQPGLGTARRPDPKARADESAPLQLPCCVAQGHWASLGTRGCLGGGKGRPRLLTCSRLFPALWAAGSQATEDSSFHMGKLRPKQIETLSCGDAVSWR